MPKILDELREEHKNMARLLRLIDRHVKAFKIGEHPDYGLVKKIVDFCLKCPDQYHHPKEDLVLDKLRTRSPESVSVIGELDKEHQKLAAFGWRFSAALGNMIEDEQLPRDWFLGVANDFLEFYDRHMQMEEVIFFLAAQRHLTEKDWREVETEAQHKLLPMTGCKTIEDIKAGYREIIAWAEGVEERAAASTAQRHGDRFELLKFDHKA